MPYITLGNLTRFLNKLKTYIGNNYLKLTGGTVNGTVNFIGDITANRVNLRSVAQEITLISNGDGNMAKEQKGKFYAFLDGKNYTKYVPKLDGTGATGTWDINISGNAVHDSEGNKIVDTYAKKSDIPTVNNITVDSAMSSTSTNPVQNKVIKSELDGKFSNSGGFIAGHMRFASPSGDVGDNPTIGADNAKWPLHFVGTTYFDNTIQANTITVTSTLNVPGGKIWIA